MIRRYLFLMLSLCALLTISCSKDDDDDDPQTKTLVESFDIPLDNANSIPAVIDRNETGDIQMSLYDDNSLEFIITINDLSDTDDLTTSHVHMGDVVSTGDVAITLVDDTNISFSDNRASGTIILTDSEVSALQGDDVYVNVHSTESASGLVRGQIDQRIDNAYNIALSPENEIPMVPDREETGSAYIRLVGSKMYYKIIVNDLNPNDAINAGHIHEGASTVNGEVFINLEISDNDQLDITKDLTLSDSELSKIKEDELYVNIHSNQAQSGLLRGQIR